MHYSDGTWSFHRTYSNLYLKPQATIFAAIILGIALLLGTFVHADAASESGQAMQGSGTTYYVSKNGNNQGGTNWQSAWNELNQIRWEQVRPGDTILLDGGVGSMTYRTAMDIRRSGEPGRPITIQRASEPGRDGQVVLFGGRSELLPSCWQRQYDYQSNGVTEFGIHMNHNAWIVIEGREWSGIVIQGFERAGIRIEPKGHDITIRNVKITNNGWAKWTNDGWYPDGVGIRLSGYNVLVERSIIHDNGQDAVQSMWGTNNIRDFRINQSWFYNGRPHPTVDESWNYCTHTDGLQLYDGGFISGVTVEESVLGPGFTNNLIMGQTPTPQGSKLDVHDVLIRDVLFMKSADNGVYGYQKTDSRNWVFDNVTMHCPQTKWHCITLDNRGHTVKDSIIYGSRLTFENGISNYTNNCIWKTEGPEIGYRANPYFVNASDSDMFSQDDYALAANSPCRGKGSKITSVRQLLQMGDSVPVGPSAPEPTPGTPEPVLDPAPEPTPGTPEPADPGPVVQCGGLDQEAETGALHGMFKVGADSRASGGAYVSVPDYSGNRGRGPDSSQRVEYCVRVPEAGMHRLKAWSYAESGYDNSFYIQIGGQPSQGYLWHSPISMDYPFDTVMAYDARSNRFNPVDVYLSEGVHMVSFFLREDGTRLDRFVLEPVGNDINREFDATDYTERLVNDLTYILETMTEEVFLPLLR